MKKIEAIIKPSKLASLRDALAQIGVVAMVIEQYRSKLKIAAIVAAQRTQQVVRAIEVAARA
jgi:nitrogen regulatory protein PII